MRFWANGIRTKPLMAKFRMFRLLTVEPRADDVAVNASMVVMTTSELWAMVPTAPRRTTGTKETSWPKNFMMS